MNENMNYVEELKKLIPTNEEVSKSRNPISGFIHSLKSGGKLHLGILFKSPNEWSFSKHFTGKSVGVRTKRNQYLITPPTISTSNELEHSTEWLMTVYPMSENWSVLAGLSSMIYFDIKRKKKFDKKRLIRVADSLIKKYESGSLTPKKVESILVGTASRVGGTERKVFVYEEKL
jgi:hypothetical protein